MGRARRSKSNTARDDARDSSDSSCNRETNMFIDDEAIEVSTEEDSSALSTEEEEEEIRFSGGLSSMGNGAPSDRKRPRADESKVEDEKSAKKRKALGNNGRISSGSNSDTSLPGAQIRTKKDSSTSTEEDYHKNDKSLRVTNSPGSLQSNAGGFESEARMALHRAKRIHYYRKKVNRSWGSNYIDQRRFRITQIACSDKFFKIKDTLPVN